MYEKTFFAGWLDLETRRLVVPPAALLAALRQLTRTADFSELDRLGRGAP
jgi:hypothetical protein